MLTKAPHQLQVGQIPQNNHALAARLNFRYHKNAYESRAVTTYFEVALSAEIDRLAYARDPDTNAVQIVAAMQRKPYRDLQTKQQRTWTLYLKSK
jgi:hypothetical protein